MKCKKCGADVPENFQFCFKCGAGDSQEDKTTENIIKPSGFSSKRNIIIIIIVSVVIALGLVGAAIAIGVSRSPERSVANALQIAERYLSELNYEQAVIEFQLVLEIEPRNVDAYLGLAEAYMGMGDKEKAIEVLREGYERTESRKIKRKRDELLNPSDETSESNSSSNSDANIPDYTDSVIIAGVKLDIEKTESLLIYNWKLYADEKGVDINECSPEIFQEMEKGYETVIHITESLSKDDLSKLSKLVNIKVLRINSAGLSDVSFLANMTKLTNLNLHKNNIKSISAVSKLVNLEVLHLQQNIVNDISPLANLKNLKELSLWSNEIVDVSPLAELTELTTLELYHNQIRDISPLVKLENLNGLSLWSNHITDITPLGELVNLSYLHLAMNEITDISPLIGLTNLTRLYLYSNQISEEDQTRLKEKLPDCSIMF